MPLDDDTAFCADRILHSAQFVHDPETLFAPLRDRHPVCPVHTRSGTPVWLISRDEGVRALLGDDRLVMTGAYAAGASGTRNALDRNLLDLDGAEHAAIRRPAAGALSARAVERHHPAIRRIIASHAAQLPAARAPERPGAAASTELISAFIRPSMLASTCTVLGIPAADWADVEQWVRALLSPQAAAVDADTALAALEPYLRRLVRQKTTVPQDDVVSAVLAAARDGGIAQDDIVSLCGMLVIAGFENTGRTLANAVHRLVTHRGEFARYARAQPAERQALLEDLIRLSLPEPLSSLRVVAHPVEIEGRVLDPGDKVMFAFGAANRDDRRYADPEALEPRPHARDHLSFGKGPHFCPGAALARLQIAVALGVLAERFDDILPADGAGPPRWTGTYRHRELSRLDVVLVPSS
ncbi:cytochrome P450 [Streptomyces sp. NPDC059456]|uniref:cytochrome P450 n=1 Tax=Streptomyces sp. NPDC059456 TaxID=3346838 RepID=UPI003678034F